jgi:hypothetical protein
VVTRLLQERSKVEPPSVYGLLRAAQLLGSEAAVVVTVSSVVVSGIAVSVVVSEIVASVVVSVIVASVLDSAIVVGTGRVASWVLEVSSAFVVSTPSPSDVLMIEFELPKSSEDVAMVSVVDAMVCSEDSEAVVDVVGISSPEVVTSDEDSEIESSEAMDVISVEAPDLLVGECGSVDDSASVLESLEGLGDWVLVGELIMSEDVVVGITILVSDRVLLNSEDVKGLNAVDSPLLTLSIVLTSEETTKGEVEVSTPTSRPS